MLPPKKIDKHIHPNSEWRSDWDSSRARISKTGIQNNRAIGYQPFLKELGHYFGEGCRGDVASSFISKIPPAILQPTEHRSPMIPSEFSVQLDFNHSGSISEAWRLPLSDSGWTHRRPSNHLKVEVGLEGNPHWWSMNSQINLTFETSPCINIVPPHPHCEILPST